MTDNRKLLDWVEEIRVLCQPEKVFWCDGSKEEYDSLMARLVASGAAVRLNPKLRPDSYLFRSHLSDVARVEDRTFIASLTPEQAGPNNNWADPVKLKATLRNLFRGCMAGRTMYIIPFVMGPIGSTFSMIGVEITDSPYVVVHMRHMTHMGVKALDALGSSGAFIPCLHSVGAPLAPGETDVSWPCAPMDQKYIAHFPEDRSIWSYGSGYGGNALLGKKCLALRIASVIARDEGWMAEHMLILGLTDPQGRKTWVTAAFPSACGKTNLAMMVPALPGFQIETIGDDIAWLRRGKDGCLRAVNPEAGFFGVAPGTSWKSNPNAMQTMDRNTIFTNTALTDEGDVWWEGIGTPAPEHLIDWQGRDWTPQSSTPAAHPNARFTVSAAQCPVISKDWEDPEGVPISAILLGGRRPGVVPLVLESTDWAHGVFLGSIMGSEITAAAISAKIGQVRRDPFAMLPFIGYNLADYLRHWLAVSQWIETDKLPKIFHVNWFRKDSSGRFLWPGFGQNIRVLQWILQRARGEGEADRTPLGFLPALGAINTDGLGSVDLEQLLRINIPEWQNEARSIREYYSKLEGLPEELASQLDALDERLKQAL